MIRLPLLGAAAHVKLLTTGLAAGERDRPATPADTAAISKRLFGEIPGGSSPALHRNATIRDLYQAIVTGEQFRAACGRISASYAW
jgi:hypothetical protein